MNTIRSYKTEEPSPRGRFFCFSVTAQRGNALLYVMIAVALLGALTYTYVKDSRENYASQGSVKITEELYSQINMIKSAVVECVDEYPVGIDPSPTGCNCSPPNPPYPLSPNDGNIKYSVSGCTTTGNQSGCTASSGSSQAVSLLTCPGAPIGSATMFSGSSNQGRFLPPIPTGFSDWTYGNDVVSGGGKGGVYIQTQVPSDETSTIAVTRLLGMFNNGTSTQISYAGGVLTVWIQNNN